MIQKAILFGIIILFLCSCDSTDNPEVRTVASAPLQNSDDALRFRDMQTLRNRQIDNSANKKSEYSFVLPAGWIEQAPKTMRNINVSFEKEPSAQCYLTVLNGQGGGLLDNVNRWRDQLGLKAITEEELSNLKSTVFLGQKAYLIEIKGNLGENNPTQLFGIISITDSALYTLKFTGPETFLTEQKQNFLSFAESIKKQLSTKNKAQKPDKTNKLLSYTLPKGWSENFTKQMRYVSFEWQDMGEVQCYIMILPLIDNLFLKNINRWREQMSLAPIEKEEDQQTIKLNTANGVCTIVALKHADINKHIQTYAGIIKTANKGIFIKLVGPSGLVDSQKEKLNELIKSLKVKDAE